ncbi:MAG: hypothetical protein AAGA53_00615 [Pseudomonadota bacterium]
MALLALTFAMTATLSVIALHMTEKENLTRKIRQMKKPQAERFASL